MPDPELNFNAARKRMDIEFHEPSSPEALQAIATRLRQDGAHCVHAMVAFGWRDPEAPHWDDPRHVEGLDRILIPPVESFIFDSGETISRQSFNTVGDAGALLEAAPALKRAFIVGCSTMRKTRHEHLRELYLAGNPLDPSVLPALGASQFPALETLALLQEQWAGSMRVDELAASLRTIDAPRLSEVYVEGAPVIELLIAIGTAPLGWNVCIGDHGFDDVEGLFQILRQHDTLRAGKLRLCSGCFFASEVAQLAELRVAADDWRDFFWPRTWSAYSSW
jgi:hypothetical protein